jgi:hypothetical protein
MAKNLKPYWKNNTKRIMGMVCLTSKHEALSTKKEKEEKKNLKACFNFSCCYVCYKAFFFCLCGGGEGAVGWGTSI